MRAAAILAVFFVSYLFFAAHGIPTRLMNSEFRLLMLFLRSFNSGFFPILKELFFIFSFDYLFCDKANEGLNY